MSVVNESVPVVSLLPEDAPFTASQRAWLDGLFLGILTSEPPETADTGSASAATASEHKAPAEEAFPWHDPAVPLAERLDMAREAAPARQFMAAMAQLDCGTCGYDCRRYAEAIAEGKEKDLTRCSPGGRETAQALKRLAQTHAPAPAGSGPAEVGVPLTVGQTGSTAPARAKPAEYDRNNPFSARFLRSRRLSGEDSAKDVRHVVVDIQGSGMTYRAGDSLGVFVNNDPGTCQAIIELLGAEGCELVAGVDGGCPDPIRVPIPKISL